MDLEQDFRIISWNLIKLAVIASLYSIETRNKLGASFNLSRR